MYTRLSALPLLLAMSLVLTACPRDPDHDQPDADFGIDVADVDVPDTDQTIPLALNSIAPDQGPMDGGTTITLSGTGFQEGIQVFFGEEEATSVVRQGQLSAQATAPAASAEGPVDVTVENPDGQTATLQGAFTYVEGDPPAPQNVGYCQLQPGPVTTEAGQLITLRAFVFVEGVTDSEGQGENVDAQLGLGDDTDSLDWADMTYLGDLEGLTPGELANDEYGFDLIPEEAGTLVYLARFRAADDDDWVLCDLEGVGTDDPGVLEVTEPAEPSIGFCQTETTSLTTAPGEESASITGLVYAFGITPGAGPGEDIDGRVLYGPASETPDEWTDTVDATYLEDADGLSPGDLANDRYTATLTIADEGTYGFIYQFRLDGGDWISCDTTTDDGFDPTAVGSLIVGDDPPPVPDSCGIQFPLIAEALQDGEDVDVYGRIFEPGVTDQADLPEGLLAEVLYGPPGADPVADPGEFTTREATRNPAYVTDDFEEFEATRSANPGTEAYVFRFSLDDGDSWTYCGIDSLQLPEDIDPDRFGALISSDETPELAGFCRTITDEATGATDSDGPTIEMEVYYEDITDIGGAPDGDALEVEVGFGAVGTNPVFAYSWAPMTYAGPMAGNPSNFRYTGAAYDEADAPDAGSYHLVTRVRAAGTEAWRYCNTSDTEPNFFLDLTTDLTVE